MNTQLLDKFIRKGRLTLIDHRGLVTVFGEGSPSVSWRLNNASTLSTILRNPQFQLGETYMAGEWDVVEGSLHDIITILRINLENNLAGRGHWYKLFSLLGGWNDIAASRRNVIHHYNLDEILFRTCLDENMHYSCAYFPDPEMSLEKAQAAKCHHIAAKLDLKPGQSVLDIGCGWGSLAIYLAEHFDVSVTGITLSSEQLRVAEERVRQRGLAKRIRFLLVDYREHADVYDRVVSVGMFEHVGKHNYKTFFNKLTAFLKPHGVALLHTISSKSMPRSVNPWIRRYIFPGGYIPSLSDIAPAVEQARLVSADIEVLRLHYALTLKAWNMRFQRNRQQFVDSKGERFCRMWEFYLVSCQTAFEVSNLVVLQWLLSKDIQAVPITRDYLYR
ncbi:MAG: class I SAM-dependent methyltransferase [Aphanocapsa feldmannii 277cV]|uniref:Class I SAM-dependent methyltransferase n=2 Tax=Aphanocapsa feldmannii TaxID=192050 RepID=A0A524RNK8_9CHRO|nr:MAG: class I SAM-dependent methyltransferase [Aphanocapsa feldmannii 277cV]TGH24567.1 MAG: class I SAM-dependent methyltransferase [Aphanocapsa feldmannii 277cI]